MLSEIQSFATDFRTFFATISSQMLEAGKRHHRATLLSFDTNLQRRRSVKTDTIVFLVLKIERRRVENPDLMLFQMMHCFLNLNVVLLLNDYGFFLVFGMVQ